MSMQLSTLLRGTDHRLIAGSTSVGVTSVENDSRKVGAGSLFVAIMGGVRDGHSFIEKCIEDGASCIVVDKNREFPSDDELKAMVQDRNCAIVEMENTRVAIAILCAQFYGHPEDRLNLVGITGTKGKTTAAFMVRKILEVSGVGTGLIGTVCNMIGNERRETERTTPESLDIYRLLNEMASKRLDSCVMEVSSHGLKFSRVHGLRFDVGCFTNFFEDHIGPQDHPDMEDYFLSKMKLFDNSRIAVVNSDCNEADRVLEYASKRCSVFTYGLTDKSDCYAKNIRRENIGGVTGSAFELVSPWYEGEVFVSLAGEFNVYNALCAICVAGILKIDFESVKKALADVFVPGRVQPIKNELGIDVVVDYAHNAASLQSVIEAIKKFAEGRIITVFGCGGNRSVVRRTEMGEVAGRYSDYTVITSDNPRDEDPLKIIDGILEGMHRTSGKYEVEPDRTTAIYKAVKMAQKGDFVLIAGKGHEDYQEFENKRRVHFSDVEVASEIIAKVTEESKE